VGKCAAGRVPTSFGPVSYSLEARARSVHVSLDAPGRVSGGALELRLRLPGGLRMTRVTLNGRPFRRFDSRTETVDLSGRSGHLDLVVALTRHRTTS
jgi:hypothetical protein